MGLRWKTWENLVCKASDVQEQREKKVGKSFYQVLQHQGT